MVNQDTAKARDLQKELIEYSRHVKNIVTIKFYGPLGRGFPFCSCHEEQEAMSGQSMKVGLTTLDLPDETINDIQNEGELEEIISAMHDKNKTAMRERSKV